MWIDARKFCFSSDLFLPISESEKTPSLWERSFSYEVLISRFIEADPIGLESNLAETFPMPTAYAGLLDNQLGDMPSESSVFRPDAEVLPITSGTASTATMNLYGYAHQNPIRFIDPTGLYAAIGQLMTPVPSMTPIPPGLQLTPPPPSHDGECVMASTWDECAEKCYPYLETGSVTTREWEFRKCMNRCLGRLGY